MDTTQNIKSKLLIWKEKYKTMEKNYLEREEDCHWLDDHRQKLCRQIISIGRIPCDIPTWNLGEVCECKCSKCWFELSDILRNDYAISINEFEKRKIVIAYLDNIEVSISREKRIKELRKLFEYLIKNRDIILDHKQFNKTIKSKLEELYYSENLRMAFGWYRRIYNKRMNVQS